MSKQDLLGRYEIVVPTLERQLAIDAFEALPQSHPIVGLLELDVTDPLARIVALQERGERVSLFAFVIHAIAVAIAEHPDLNLVCHGQRLIRFEDVDVSVPVEVHTPDGSFPRQLVLRRAQHLSPQQIYAELEGARRRQASAGEVSREDRWVRSIAGAVRILPRPVRVAFVRRIMRSGFRIKEHAGTTLVTSVGKFASLPGGGFSFTTGPRASTFAVGGVFAKPWIHEGKIVPRSILALSIIVNHDLVDGAPAARFAMRLKELIESGEGLSVAPHRAAEADEQWQQQR